MIVFIKISTFLSPFVYNLTYSYKSMLSFNTWLTFLCNIPFICNSAHSHKFISVLYWSLVAHNAIITIVVKTPLFSFSFFLWVLLAVTPSSGHTVTKQNKNHQSNLSNYTLIKFVSIWCIYYHIVILYFYNCVYKLAIKVNHCNNNQRRTLYYNITNSNTDLISNNYKQKSLMFIVEEIVTLRLLYSVSCCLFKELWMNEWMNEWDFIS